MQEKNIGSVVQIIGPVLDIRFPAGHLRQLPEHPVCPVPRNGQPDTLAFPF